MTLPSELDIEAISSPQVQVLAGWNSNSYHPHGLDEDLMRCEAASRAWVAGVCHRLLARTREPENEQSLEGIKLGEARFCNSLPYRLSSPIAQHEVAAIAERHKIQDLASDE